MYCYANRLFLTQGEAVVFERIARARERYLMETLESSRNSAYVALQEWRMQWTVPELTEEEFAEMMEVSPERVSAVMQMYSGVIFRQNHIVIETIGYYDRLNNSRLESMIRSITRVADDWILSLERDRQSIAPDTPNQTVEIPRYSVHELNAPVERVQSRLRVQLIDVVDNMNRKYGRTVVSVGNELVYVNKFVYLTEDSLALSGYKYPTNLKPHISISEYERLIDWNTPVDFRLDIYNANLTMPQLGYVKTEGDGLYFLTYRAGSYQRAYSDATINIERVRPARDLPEQETYSPYLVLNTFKRKISQNVKEDVLRKVEVILVNSKLALLYNAGLGNYKVLYNGNQIGSYTTKFNINNSLRHLRPLITHEAGGIL